MKDYEFRILSIAILALCLLVVVMGIKVESLKDKNEQRYIEAPVEYAPAISDSVSIGRDSCMERLR